MSKIIQIDGYLIQSKLESVIKNLVGDRWNGAEILVSDKNKYRWDLSYKEDNKIVFVEFDGDRHYREPFVIKNDNNKNRIAKESGCKVIRIPYWVQLTTQTLKYYFDIDNEINQNFPHGFITSKWFPSSYCELGLERFAKELLTLPENVRFDVVKSLRERSLEHGVKYVVPHGLL